MKGCKNWKGQVSWAQEFATIGLAQLTLSWNTSSPELDSTTRAMSWKSRMDLALTTCLWCSLVVPGSRRWSLVVPVGPYGSAVVPVSSPMAISDISSDRQISVFPAPVGPMMKQQCLTYKDHQGLTCQGSLLSELTTY